MGENNFNTRQCIRALKQIGFTLENTYQGGHDKYVPPHWVMEKLQGTQPRFITVPRHRIIRCQYEIISELRKMGGDDLVARFRENL